MPSKERGVATWQIIPRITQTWYYYNNRSTLVDLLLTLQQHILIITYGVIEKGVTARDFAKVPAYCSSEAIH